LNFGDFQSQPIAHLLIYTTRFLPNTGYISEINILVHFNEKKMGIITGKWTGLYHLNGFSTSSDPKAEVITSDRNEVKSCEPPRNQQRTDNHKETSIQICVKPAENGNRQILFKLRLGSITRNLNWTVREDETGSNLAKELVHYGFIKQGDEQKLASVIHENLTDQ